MDDRSSWSVEELVHRAGLALVGSARAGTYSGPPNGRVRGLPDQRVIRWYTTIGLLDRPLGGRGRGARYGVRHLRQLVAVKLLQSQGLPLAEIQARLAGISDAALDALAPLPPDALAPLPPEGSVPSESVPPGAAEGVPLPVAPRRFWATAPLPPPGAPAAGSPPSPPPPSSRPAFPGPSLPTLPSPGPSAGSGRGAWASAPATAGGGARLPAPDTDGHLDAERHPVVEPLAGLRLAPGVFLVLSVLPDPADVPALADAARPLLAALTDRGLVLPPATSGGPTEEGAHR